MGGTEGGRWDSRMGPFAPRIAYVNKKENYVAGERERQKEREREGNRKRGKGREREREREREGEREGER